MRKDEYKKEIISVLYTVIWCLESRRPYAAGHSKRVAEMARTVAEHLGLRDQECEDIFAAGLLHDIGYLGLPDDLFQSTEQLSPQQREALGDYLPMGVQILSRSSLLAEICTIINYHHHRFDGRGGPGEPAGSELPIGSRILHITEVFDALTTPRPHRERLSIEEALIELERDPGRFDPDLVRTAVEVLGLEILASDHSGRDLARFSRSVKRLAEGVVSGKAQVPAVPRVIRAMKGLWDNEETNLKKISSVIELDPSLALRVISIANSAMFFGMPPINSVADALIRIGLNQARDLVMTYTYSTLFTSKQLVFRRIFDEMWEHSLLCSVITQSLAGSASIDHGGYAYLLGLLHDVGKLCLLKAFTDMWEEKSLSEAQLEILQEVIAESHRAVSARLLREAKLPLKFQNAIVRWTRKGTSRSTPEALLLSLAHGVVGLVPNLAADERPDFKRLISASKLDLTPEALRRALGLALQRYQFIRSLLLAENGDVSNRS